MVSCVTFHWIVNFQALEAITNNPSWEDGSETASTPSPSPHGKKKEIHQVTIGIGLKGGVSPLNQSKGQEKQKPMQSRITLDAPWKTEIESENLFARWVNLEFFGLEREEF